MSSGGFKVPDDIMAPVILIVCVPTLLVLFIALLFPDYIDRCLGGDPMVLLKPAMSAAFGKRGIEWADIEPLLKKLSIEELKDAYQEGGITDVLKLVSSKGGDEAKKLAVVVAKPLLQPVINKLGVDWENAQMILQKLPMAELEVAFTDPVEFAQQMSSRLAKAAVKPVVVPFLDAKGFEWDFFVGILDAVDSTEDIQELMSDPAGFLQGIATDDPTAATMLVIMDLRAELETEVSAKAIQWKEAVSIMCDATLVTLDDLQAANEDPGVLLSIIVEHAPQLRRKLRSKMKQISSMMEVRRGLSSKHLSSRSNKVSPFPSLVSSAEGPGTDTTIAPGVGKDGIQEDEVFEIAKGGQTQAQVEDVSIQT